MSTSTKDFTVMTAKADGSAVRSVTANGIGGAGTYLVSSTIRTGDTATASTGAYYVTTSFTGAGVGTLAINLGGSALSPMATAAVGTLTSSAVALAKSIKLANTSGVTAAQTYLKAPAAVDTGTVSASGSLTANPMVYYANSATVPVLSYLITGTAT